MATNAPFGAPVRANVDPVTGGINILAAGQSIPLRSSRTVAFFGDSITNAPGQAMLFGFRITSGNFADSGTNITYANILWVDPETPAGVGALTYNATTKLITWAANGETAGAAVDVSRSGIYYLSSSTAAHGITLALDGDNATFSTGTAAVTVPGDGFQYQAIYNSRGYAPVALMLAGPSWDFADATGVYSFKIACGGLPGAGSAGLVSAIWQTSQIEADVDIIEIGTNDVAGNKTAASIIANLKTFIASRFAVGTKNVGMMTIPPRDGNSATQNKVRSQVNRWMFDYANVTPGLAVLDVAAAITDPSNAHYVSGFGSAADSPTPVHPSNLGAFQMAKVAANWLISIYKDMSFLPDFGDLWDATYNPYGSLIPSGGYNSFEGTGGTAGTGASGVVPDNFTLGRDVGAAMTAVGSKVARTDGVAGNWYQVVLANAAAAASPWERVRLFPTLSSTLSTYGLSPGDPLDFLAEVNIPSSSGLVYLDAEITFAGVNARSIRCNTDSIIGGNAPLTDNIGKIWLRAPKGATIPVGATGFRVYFYIGTTNAGTPGATIQFGRYSLRKARVSP